MNMLDMVAYLKDQQTQGLTVIGELIDYNVEKNTATFMVAKGLAPLPNVPIAGQVEGVAHPIITGELWVLSTSRLDNSSVTETLSTPEQLTFNAQSNNTIAVCRYRPTPNPTDSMIIWYENSKITLKKDELKLEVGESVITLANDKVSVVSSGDILLGDAKKLVLNEDAELSVTVTALNTPMKVEIKDAGQGKVKA